MMGTSTCVSPAGPGGGEVPKAEGSQAGLVTRGPRGRVRSSPGYSLLHLAEACDG